MRLRGHFQHQMLDAEIPVGPQPLHNACDAPREMITTGSSGLVVQHILGNPLDGAGDAHGEDRFSHASPLRPLVACIGDTCLELIERHGSGVPAIPKLRHTAPRRRLLPPIQMGGCGCCTGRGDACMSANMKYRPSKLTFSCVHSALINRKHSSLNAPRSAKGAPKAANSGSIQPTAAPKSCGRPRADR